MRHSQNDGYVIAVDLSDKKYGGFTWVLRKFYGALFQRLLREIVY